MPSRHDRRTGASRPAPLLCVTLLILGHGVGAQTSPPELQNSVFTIEQVDAARDRVRSDPALSPSTTIKMIRWKPTSTEPVSWFDGLEQWFGWVSGLVRWINQTGRVTMLAALVALIAFLVVYMLRTLRRLEPAVPRDAALVPTHVGDLDIRPASLPDDVGRAARALWDRGESRAALALLYRGLISRLVHRHHVPLRDSSTEGDCLAVAVSFVSPATHGYASRLVRVWQRSVYGGDLATADTVYALCDEFAGALDATPRAATTARVIG